MALHRFEAAERDLRAVLERAPANRQALNNLGAICIRQRRLGEAVGWFRRGLEKLPSGAGWLTKLAAAMEMQNDLSGAAQAAQQALAAHPEVITTEVISPLAPLFDWREVVCRACRLPCRLGIATDYLSTIGPSLVIWIRAKVQRNLTT